MKQLAAITILLLCAALPAFAQPQEEEHRFHYEPGEGIDHVHLDGQPYIDLVYGRTEQFGEIPRPFFYPIVGPTGAHLTRNYPMVEGVEGEASDHPHHRSIWFAHGNVNGVDFWTQGNNRGTIQAGPTWVLLNHSVNPDGQAIWPTAIMSRQDTWITPAGDAVLTNNTAYAVDVLDDGSRVLEIWQNLSPAEGVDEVTFGDTKEGTMAIRLHPALRLRGDVATGHCINSEGDTDGDCWGKRAAWVAYWGTIDGEVCGVAIFDHPTNLRHPTWWHARDYGLVAANPFGQHDFERGTPAGTGDYTLPAGQTLSLRYRFVFFAGTAEEADIAGKYAQWIEMVAVPLTLGPVPEDAEE